MGHTRLGSLPKTRKWQQVVALIDGGADLASIADATAEAAESALKHAAGDPSFAHAFWLLTQLPQAAREDDFSSALAALGIRVSGAPTLLELAAGFSDAIDAHARRSDKGRSDLGEMAHLAAVHALTRVVNDRLPSLFSPSPADVQGAVAAVGTSKQFGDLARTFFANLTNRYLGYFLSRELSNHVGADGRFRSIQEHREFDTALAHHCVQAARIVEEFAGAWYSKTRYETGIRPADAGRFAYVAFKKVRAELRQRRGLDAA